MDIQDTFFFMNSETFEEIPVASKIMEDKVDWVEEGAEVQLVIFKNNVIEVSIPTTGISASPGFPPIS